MLHIHKADALVEVFADAVFVSGVGVDGEPGRAFALDGCDAGGRVFRFVLDGVFREEGGDGSFFDFNGLVEPEFGDGLDDVGIRIDGRFVFLALDAEVAGELQHFLQLALGAGQGARGGLCHFGLRWDALGGRGRRHAGQGSRVFSTTRLSPKSIAPRKMPMAIETTRTTTVRLAVS